MGRRKILRLFSNLGVGGVQKQYLQILKTGELNNYEILIGTFSSPVSLKEEYKKVVSDIITIPFNGKYSPATLLNLCKVYKDYKCDLIHVSKMEDIIPISFIAAKICKIPVIVQYHFPYSWKSKRKLEIDRFLAILSSDIICVSRYVREFIIKKLRLYEKQIITIYNGYFSKTYKPTKKRKHKKITIIVIARLVKFKRLEDLIKTLKLIMNYRQDIELIVIGDGPERERLEKLSQNLPVKWEGEIKDIEKYLVNADLGILPSSKEGLGNAVIEYIFNGLTPLTSNIPPLKEIVPDTHSSVSFTPKFPEEIFKAILYLMENPKVRKKTSINASHRARNFNIKRTVSSLRNVYDKVLFHRLKTFK